MVSASSDLEVGIHLTADYAVVALGDHSTQRVLSNSAGSLFTPSAVSLDTRGRIRVGGEAWARATGAVDSNAVANLLDRLEQGADGGHDFGDGRHMRAPELMAELLKSLRTDFRATTGEEMSAAVLAIPAGASDQLKTELRESTSLAGIESVAFLPEPVAASFGVDLDHSIRRSSEGRPVNWLVCQAEDGGFSVSVLGRTDKELSIVSHIARASVNGDTLNQRLARDYVANAPWAQDIEWEDIDASAQARLLLEVEDAKRDVWRLGQSAEVFIAGLPARSGTDPVQIEFELTPALLEHSCREELAAGVQLCRTLIAEAGLTEESLGAIVLVGTCATDPDLRTALSAAFGRSTLVDPDPRTVIARGATAWAASRRAPTGQAEDPEEVEPTVADDAPSGAGASGDSPPPEGQEPAQDEVPEPEPSIAPERLAQLRSDLRTQRHRLLALHALVTRAGEFEDRTLAIAVVELVRSRQYERADGLFVDARAGKSVAEAELSDAIASLSSALDELESLR